MEPRTKLRVKPKEPHRASLFGTTFDRTSAITWHLIHLYILGFKWSVFWTYLNLSLELLEKQPESFAEDREEIVNVVHTAGTVWSSLWCQEDLQWRVQWSRHIWKSLCKQSWIARLIHTMESTLWNLQPEQPGEFSRVLKLYPRSFFLNCSKNPNCIYQFDMPSSISLKKEEISRKSEKMFGGRIWRNWFSKRCSLLSDAFFTFRGLESLGLPS